MKNSECTLSKETQDLLYRYFAAAANREEFCYDKDNVCVPWDDSRTLYKPQYSFVNLGKSRSVEKYKTTKRLLFNGFKISFYALSLIWL